MITNTSYIDFFKSVSSAYCGTDKLCSENLLTRLKLYLDNDLASYVISNLKVGRFYLLKILDIKPNGLTKVDIKFSGEDLIAGTVQTGTIIGVSLTQLNEKKFKDIFAKVGQTLVGTVVVKTLSVSYFFTHKISAPGYDLILDRAVVPTDETMESSTGAETVGGGSVTDTINNILNQVLPSNISSTGEVIPVDYSKYVVPAAIVLGIYLLLK